MVLLCSVCFGLPVIAATPAWDDRISMVGCYAGFGAVLAEALKRADARRRAGAGLTKLGMVYPRRAVIVSIVVGAAGLLGSGIRLFQLRKFGVTMQLGWCLFFAVTIAQGVRPWLMTQFGLSGPRFIPWAEIAEYA
jgi:hypothetical protein